MSSRAAWDDAALAAVLVALDPAGAGGIALRAHAGPVRDAWCSLFRALLRPSAPYLKLPLGVTEDRLLGGLDLVQTLRTGRAVEERGLLAQADGGVLAVSMAERLDAHVTAHLCAALDRGEQPLERDGLRGVNAARLGILALDEGEVGERTAPALLDRLAVHVSLDEVPLRTLEAIEDEEPPDLAEARSALPTISIRDEVWEALCATALALGIDSLRAPLLAGHIARAAAAFAGRSTVAEADLTMAVRLVLAPRATQLPALPEPADEETREETDEEPEAPAPDEDPDDTPEPPGDAPDDVTRPEDAGALTDILVQAAVAALPPGLLAELSRTHAPRRGPHKVGAAGTLRASLSRGRRAGALRGLPRGGRRLHVLETLRAAAPWQGVRRAARAEAGLPAARVEVRAGDLRVHRYQERSESSTIFVVDASGSAALERLAEAKGAVELVLADCYVRRDHVALLAFRGTKAELLLAPTRSLMRAKRSLAGLVGGGGTPLATGIEAALLLALEARRQGHTPLLVFMTDGRANIGLDGRPGRAKAEADALSAARALAQHGVQTLLIDTAARARPEAARLAREMSARFVALPSVDASLIAREVRAIGGETP